VSPVKVLYVGGTGRSGSTIIEKLVGQFDGVFAAGETMWLWYALRGNGRCSCGAPLRACTTWLPIFNRAFGEGSAIDPEALFASQWRFHSGHLPLLTVPAASRHLLARSAVHRRALESVFLAISEVTGARTIVDKSLSPHHSYVLRQSPHLDVHFLHLERDPRAIAYSWGKPVAERGFDGRKLMERRGVVRSAIFHNVSNVAAEVLWAREPGRYLRMRYEDFADDPAGGVDRIGQFIGEDFDARAVLCGSQAKVRPVHSCWGNPNRFDNGLLTVERDDSWIEQYPSTSKVLTTLLTWPLLRRYGYPCRPLRQAAGRVPVRRPPASAGRG
jgi:hypothetical protein